MPWEAYAASMGLAEACPHHGRACTCPTACKRADGGHGDQTSEPAPDVPACHRKSAEESGTEKSSCTINRCGGSEAPQQIAVAAELYLGGDTAIEFAVTAWRRALREALPSPPARKAPPPEHPPRTLSVRFI